VDRKSKKKRRTAKKSKKRRTAKADSKISTPFFKADSKIHRGVQPLLMGVEHFATPLCDPPCGFRQNAKFFIIFTWKKADSKNWTAKIKGGQQKLDPLIKGCTTPVNGGWTLATPFFTSHRGVAKKAKKSKKGGRQKKADSKIKGGKQKGGQQNKIKNGQLNKSGQQKKTGAAKFFKNAQKKFR